jgi:hypothetical protein
MKRREVDENRERTLTARLTQRPAHRGGLIAIPPSMLRPPELMIHGVRDKKSD